MKYIKLYEGFLSDANAPYVGSPPPRRVLIGVEQMALELLEPLLEPIRDHYELDYNDGLSPNKLQLYFTLSLRDNEDKLSLPDIGWHGGKVTVDPRLFKLLRSLSAKLKEYGLRVLIEKPSIAKLFSKSVDIDVDELSKDKVYQTGYILIRDENYTKPKSGGSTGAR